MTTDPDIARLKEEIRSLEASGTIRAENLAAAKQRLLGVRNQLAAVVVEIDAFLAPVSTPAPPHG